MLLTLECLSLFHLADKNLLNDVPGRFIVLYIPKGKITQRTIPGSKDFFYFIGICLFHTHAFVVSYLLRDFYAKIKYSA